MGGEGEEEGKGQDDPIAVLSNALLLMPAALLKHSETASVIYYGSHGSNASMEGQESSSSHRVIAD